MKLRNRSHRFRLLLTALIATVALTSGCASNAAPRSKAEEIQTVKFGYVADFNGSYALAVADKLDLWSKYGVRVEPRVFTNGPLQIQAIKTGDLDTGSIGPGALWMPASGQAKVISINGVGLADRVVALPGRGIASMADLKGKKIGVPQGTSGDMILQMALKKAGMTSQDVQIVNMDPSTVDRRIGHVGWPPLFGTRWSTQSKSRSQGCWSSLRAGSSTRRILFPVPSWPAMTLPPRTSRPW